MSHFKAQSANTQLFSFNRYYRIYRVMFTAAMTFVVAFFFVIFTDMTRSANAPKPFATTAAYVVMYVSICAFLFMAFQFAPMIQRRDMLLALNGAAKQASPMLPYGQFIPMDNGRRLRIVKVLKGGYMLVINHETGNVQEVSFLITRQELVQLTTSSGNPFDQLTEVLVAIRKYSAEPD